MSADPYNHEYTMTRIADALEEIVSQLSRIGLSEGPCDGFFREALSYFTDAEGHQKVSSSRNYVCSLTALHTGLHKADGGKTWTEEENKKTRHYDGSLE